MKKLLTGVFCLSMVMAGAQTVFAKDFDAKKPQRPPMEKGYKKPPMKLDKVLNLTDQQKELAWICSITGFNSFLP